MTKWEKFVGHIAFRIAGKPVHTFVLIGATIVLLLVLAERGYYYGWW